MFADNHVHGTIISGPVGSERKIRPEPGIMGKEMTNSYLFLAVFFKLRPVFKDLRERSKVKDRINRHRLLRRFNGTVTIGLSEDYSVRTSHDQHCAWNPA